MKYKHRWLKQNHWCSFHASSEADKEDKKAKAAPGVLRLVLDRQPHASEKVSFKWRDLLKGKGEGWSGPIKRRNNHVMTLLTASSEDIISFIAKNISSGRYGQRGKAELLSLNNPLWLHGHLVSEGLILCGKHFNGKCILISHKE